MNHNSGSYCSRDIEDCGSAPWRKFTLKPTTIPYMMMWQYWLGKTKPQRSFLNAFKKLLQNKKKLMEFSTDWLTAYLPAWYLQICVIQQWLRYGLVFFLLFNVTSAREVSFGALLFIQCSLHELTSALHSVPFIFAHHEKCRFCGRHIMASIYNL